MSRLRKVYDVSAGKYSAKVYRDAEWNEYRVKFFINGNHITEADYFDSNKEDAINTATSEVNRSAQRG